MKKVDAIWMFRVSQFRMFRVSQFRMFRVSQFRYQNTNLSLNDDECLQREGDALTVAHTGKGLTLGSMQ